MRRSALWIVVAVTLFSAVDSSALRLGGGRVIVPVIARVPGAEGSLWRTDLFIGNPYAGEAAIRVRLHSSGGFQEFESAVPQFGSVSFPDVILTKFGRETASGMLEVLSGQDVDVRARIYNAGSSAGIFAQSLEGIAEVYLRRQAWLFGLNGTPGNRINIGVANPNNQPVEVQIAIMNGIRQMIHSFSVTVPANEVIQYNDIVARFGFAPQTDIQVDMMTSSGMNIYGYASEVRNDTSDALFIFGVGPNV